MQESLPLDDVVRAQSSHCAIRDDSRLIDVNYTVLRCDSTAEEAAVKEEGEGEGEEEDEKEAEEE